MGEWIDFKQLREQLDFPAVLAYYGVRIKSTPGGQHKGRCPLPTHPKENMSQSFSANLKRKIWRCFGCSTSGNILDFALRMSGLNPKNPADVRKGALQLRAQFSSSESQVSASPKPTRKPLTPERLHSPVESRATAEAQALINAPLDFALKNLSTDHSFFSRRVLRPETIEHFGLGYCTKGMFAGRVAIPLHNAGGQLIGYAGQLADEFEVTDDQPQYLWPGPRERKGAKLIFDRSKFVYHGHRIGKSVTDIVIVQSPESAWWVWQAGFPNVVGLMNDSPSKDQSDLIVRSVLPRGRVWLLTDGDKEGERCAAELFYDIGPQRFCTWLKLSGGQPKDCTVDELREMLAWKASA